MVTGRHLPEELVEIKNPIAAELRGMYPTETINKIRTENQELMKMSNSQSIR